MGQDEEIIYISGLMRTMRDGSANSEWQRIKNGVGENSHAKSSEYIRWESCPELLPPEMNYSLQIGIETLLRSVWHSSIRNSYQ